MSGQLLSAESRQAGAASTEWGKLLAGLAVIFGLFHGLATALGSDRGQAGLLVAAAVVAALLAAEWLLFRQAPAEPLLSLGFGRPTSHSMLAALGVRAAIAGGDQGGGAAWRHRPTPGLDGGERCDSLSCTSLLASFVCAPFAGCLFLAQSRHRLRCSRMSAFGVKQTKRGRRSDVPF